MATHHLVGSGAAGSGLVDSGLVGSGVVGGIRRRALGILAVLAVGLGLVVGTASPAAAAGCSSGAVRFAKSSNILYVSGPVTCTLTDLDRLSSAPLTLVDPAKKVWLLGANLVLQEGATLNLHGSEVGGDVEELRMRSNNNTQATSVIYLRAYWGNVSMKSTKVTSWDENAKKPDTEYAQYRRSYIHVRSFLESGETPRQSRMDIADSDLGYLGHPGAEAYGVSWKVLGTGVFDQVDVFGDVTNSRFHHNYYGAYTYGAFGMQWVGNEFDNNISYGLDPHDDSDNLLIENNHSHDNGNHGIICSQRCDTLVIRNNRSENNVGHGIMLHRSVNDSLVEGNFIAGNTDTGLPVFESFNNVIRNNTITGNRRGIRLSLGSANNLFENNDVVGNTSYGLYFYKGSDVSVVGDGRPRANRFVSNRVRDNGGNAIQASDTDDNLFEGNQFSGNAGGMLFQNAKGNKVAGSDLGGMTVDTRGSGSTTELSRFNRADVRVDASAVTRLTDPQGAVFDPEEALVTTIGSTGSELVLNASKIGTGSVVVTRNLEATANGTASVDPTEWQTSGSLRKQWKSQGPASLVVGYKVGDLAPGATYQVVKDGSVIGRVTADGTGVASFSDTLGSSSSRAYTVQP
jgi:parallel beta-helix repeat protein